MKGKRRMGWLTSRFRELLRMIVERCNFGTLHAKSQRWLRPPAKQTCKGMFKLSLLFVAGTNSREKTSKSFDEFVMKLLDNYPFDVSGASDNDPLKKVSLKKVHWLGSSSGINTVVQARWVVQKMQAFKFETVALHVSPYHLPRAYATLLKQMLIANVRFAIIPVSVRIAPHVEIPESGATA